jgi:hypothetical protein
VTAHVHALFLGGAYASATLPLLAVATRFPGWWEFVSVGLALALTVAVAVAIFLGLRERPRARRRATDVLVLVLLPFAVLQGPECGTCSLGEGNVYRRLAMPEILGLGAGYAASLVAYAISRRRPERQRPGTELLIGSMLLCGCALMVPVAVQFGGLVFMDAGLRSVGASWAFMLPQAVVALVPLGVIALYAYELGQRLKRRGQEQGDGTTPADRFARLMGGSLALAGVYSLLHAFWFGSIAGVLRVFTRTCGAPLSQLAMPTIPCAGDHYLCTVAAQGHRWLVRPERLGHRRGQPILVNRQLALANAFEDLLHERWPRLGRRARRIYDQVGLPISRLIRSPWLADAVFLAMKPAEWCFYLALLLLDHAPPEARIARMYPFTKTSPSLNVRLAAVELAGLRSARPVPGVVEKE